MRPSFLFLSFTKMLNYSFSYFFFDSIEYIQHTMTKVTKKMKQMRKLRKSQTMKEQSTHLVSNQSSSIIMAYKITIMMISKNVTQLNMTHCLQKSCFLRDLRMFCGHRQQNLHIDMSRHKKQSMNIQIMMRNTVPRSMIEQYEPQSSLSNFSLKWP